MGPPSYSSYVLHPQAYGMKEKFTCVRVHPSMHAAEHPATHQLLSAGLSPLLSRRGLVHMYVLQERPHQALE